MPGSSRSSCWQAAAGEFAGIDVAAGDVPLMTVSLAYQQQPVVVDGIGIPRDGGMADLLAEAAGPAPAFAAVVCEDINRSARDSFNALKLEKNSPPAASPCSPPTSPSSSKAPTPPPSCCAG
jgi:hypothetical protein